MLRVCLRKELSPFKEINFSTEKFLNYRTWADLHTKLILFLCCALFSVVTQASPSPFPEHSAVPATPHAIRVPLFMR